MAYPMVLLDGHSRNSVIHNLTRRGVECRPLFGCIPTQQPAYAKYANSGRWVNAEWLGRKGFYVGCHQYLTDKDLELMAQEIKFAVEESEEE
jgi:CDP-6-deoxy-D-xylo-4-hexulose-3-dehydrase